MKENTVFVGIKIKATDQIEFVEKKMGKKKARTYRIKEFDPINDLYILQEKFMFIFWRTISAGSKVRLQEYINSQKED